MFKADGIYITVRVAPKPRRPQPPAAPPRPRPASAPVLLSPLVTVLTFSTAPVQLSAL